MDLETLNPLLANLDSEDAASENTEGAQEGGDSQETPDSAPETTEDEVGNTEPEGMDDGDEE